MRFSDARATAMKLFRLLRQAALAAILAAALLAGTSVADEPPRALRVGMTPAFLHHQHSMLAEWKLYLERALERPIVFVQRDSYQETMDLLRQGALDFAWLCDYPYIALGDAVRLLAVASYQGQPHYRSYLIDRRLELRRDDAREDVGGPARRERNDDANDLAEFLGRKARLGEHRHGGEARGGKKTADAGRFHERFLQVINRWVRRTDVLRAAGGAVKGGPGARQADRRAARRKDGDGEAEPPVPGRVALASNPSTHSFP